MTTSVIQTLETSDRSRSPSVFPPLSVRDIPDEGAAGRMRDLSNVCYVSQSGVPVEDGDVNNCSLDLSLRTSDWDVSPPSPEPSRYPSEEEESHMNVSSSCEEDEKVNEAEMLPECSTFNLTSSSETSSFVSGSSESKGCAVENSVCVPVISENSNTSNVPVKTENNYDSDHVQPENSGLVPVKAENDDDYESGVQENVSSASNVAQSSDLVNISDSNENDAMDMSYGEASEVINVTETDNDEVINVTSTTQESDLAETPLSPEQEVVDVESYQPCVVDLTCEEEDDVDVVAVVEPVIFIGTGQGRRNRVNNPSPPIEDLTDAVVEHEELAETIDDETNNNNAAVDNERNGMLWPMMNPPEIDLQNPNLTFGSLLEQAHIETVDDNQQPPPQRPTTPRELRRLRRTTRRQRRSRSRSPSLFPEMDFDNDPPHIANLMMAIDDIMHEGDWEPPLAPNQLPLAVNPVVVGGPHDRGAQFIGDLRQGANRVGTPKPPPSPPPVEQPTISCLVCLDSIATINSSSRSLCSTVCGHVFCSACIEEVVKQRKQCPVCRKRLTKKQYHPLFI